MKPPPLHRALPPELLATARVVFDQPLWPPTAALDVIGWYAGHSIAVVGVERYLVLNGFPKWLGATANEAEPDGDWPAYVADCAEAARAFVEAEAEDAWFALSVMRERDPRGIREGEPTRRASSAGPSLWDRVRRLFGGGAGPSAGG